MIDGCQSRCVGAVGGPTFVAGETRRNPTVGLSHLVILRAIPAKQASVGVPIETGSDREWCAFAPVAGGYVGALGQQGFDDFGIDA